MNSDHSNQKPCSLSQMAAWCEDWVLPDWMHPDVMLIEEGSL
ncbi:hypothetical protein [Bifidobacterium animalis]|nr:hypothetical protein [Bifidobacterium animalis]MCR1996009.1 hypothetical protein [Bifidobacterium animalis subsp. animalis]